MSNTCPVCTHSQRHVIDHELARDSSISALSDAYGLSQGAIVWHFAGCLLGVDASLEAEAGREEAGKARADAQRDAVGAFDCDAGALDALLDAILEPQPTASRSQSKGGGS